MQNLFDNFDYLWGEGGLHIHNWEKAHFIIFPFHALHSLVPSTGFSLFLFPIFIAIFILLPTKNNIRLW